MLYEVHRSIRTLESPSLWLHLLKKVERRWNHYYEQSLFITAMILHPMIRANLIKGSESGAVHPSVACQKLVQYVEHYYERFFFERPTMQQSNDLMKNLMRYLVWNDEYELEDSFSPSAYWLRRATGSLILPRVGHR